MLQYLKTLLMFLCAEDTLKRTKVAIMAIAPIPLTAGGIWSIIDAFTKTGATIFGFATSFVGFLTACLIFRWWLKKNKKDFR